MHIAAVACSSSLTSFEIIAFDQASEMDPGSIRALFTWDGLVESSVFIFVWLRDYVPQESPTRNLVPNERGMTKCAS